MYGSFRNGALGIFRTVFARGSAALVLAGVVGGFCSGAWAEPLVDDWSQSYGDATENT
jgi:hypothetical protein